MKFSYMTLSCMITALALFAKGTSAQYPDVNGEIVTGKYILDTQQIAFSLFVPAEYEPGQSLPIVVALHALAQWGDGGASPWLAYGLGNAFAGKSGTEIEPCFMLLPQCPAWNQWVDWDFTKGNYSIDSVPMAPEHATAVSLADSIISAYTIDTNRIYLVGLSMGAMGVWDLLARFPGKYTAAFALSGSGDPDKTSLMLDTPIWGAHGFKDEEVPPESTLDLMLALDSAGADVLFIDASHDDLLGGYTQGQIYASKHIYSEYWNGTHTDYWQKFLYDSVHVQWLLSQSKGGVSNSSFSSILKNTTPFNGTGPAKTLALFQLPSKAIYYDCLGKRYTINARLSLLNTKQSSGMLIRY